LISCPSLRRGEVHFSVSDGPVRLSARKLTDFPDMIKRTLTTWLPNSPRSRNATAGGRSSGGSCAARSTACDGDPVQPKYATAFWKSFNPSPSPAMPRRVQCGC
jgi:hypothetical protein